MRVHDRLFIGGEWVEPAGTATIDVISPSTRSWSGGVPDGIEADMDRCYRPPPARRSMMVSGPAWHRPNGPPSWASSPTSTPPR